ncbi:PepSY domain-containing protein [Actibacterium sp.]|uniref:PepSY domain-containing protein n=1 Tax=Actibacterium sp. TaxID=1872125 RepID=UPI0035687811
MRKYMIAPALSLSLAVALAGPALASRYESAHPETAAQITAMLAEQGYEVRKIETEDGLIEVYALKDGNRVELYLDAELNIVRVKSKD